VNELADVEREAIERNKQLDLEREASDLAQTTFDNQRQQLSLQADLADTQADRKRLAFEILDLEQQYRRNQLEMVLASSTANDAEKRRAQAILDSLDAIDAGERASVGRSNETDVERYIRNVNMTAGQINEAVDGIKLEGLDALNNGLVDAITGVKSLGKVFSDVANQIISDLLRIAIRKAIIAPLANALFGGAKLLGGGGGAGFGAILDTSSVRGHASGTQYHSGGLAWVGERGRELVRLPGGSQVIPNRDLKGMGGSIAQIVPSPYFDVVVDGRIVRASPAIMQGGAQVAQSQMAYRNTRRVA
jgi:phage-related tail protein